VSADLFWLSDKQFAKLESLLPTDTRGKKRVDDRRGISGIIYVQKSSGRWVDAPADFGPRTRALTRNLRRLNRLRRVLTNYARIGRRQIERGSSDSSNFFRSQPIFLEPRHAGRELVFQPTGLDGSDGLSARVFGSGGATKAVVLLPHWNAQVGANDTICRALASARFTAVCLTLPHHGTRTAPGDNMANRFVSANLELTIRSIQRSVRETSATVAWLKKCGHHRVALVGFSLGSCVAALTASMTVRSTQQSWHLLQATSQKSSGQAERPSMSARLSRNT
jgi:transposase